MRHVRVLHIGRRAALAVVCLALALTASVAAPFAIAAAPAIAACVADFSPATTSPETVGNAPASVAVGDFNLDGKPDLAVANESDDNVSILLGDGTGNFTPAPTSPEGAGNSPHAVAVGDFNNDGKPDLAVTNNGPSTVTILLGDGTGNFTAAPTSPEATGDAPVAVAIGDFNLDGNLDLATANQASTNVSILLGDGTGNFTATAPKATGDQPVFVVVGDFNQDGKPDLAVANAGDDNVTILLGDGTGAFTEPASSPEAVGNTPFSIVVDDFNADGKPDLAVANQGSDNVTILLGDGAGNFTPAATSPEAAGNGPYSIAVGDFNVDGKPDLAVANVDGANVSILLGDGTGNFSAAATSLEAVGVQPESVVVGDFNQDGKPDLAVANFVSDNVTILLNTCPVNACGLSDFTTASTSPEAVGDGPQFVAVGDFNRDGKLDLAVANSNSFDVTILLGDGAGNFSAAPTSPEGAGVGANAIAVGDFNLDGELDLAVANHDDDHVTILLGNGTGDFSEPASSPENVGSDPASVVVGDFNGDGRPDLAVANASSDNVSILLGDGTGNFSPAPTSPEGAGTSPTSIAVGDFNRDGKLDLAVTNLESDNVTILLGDGTGNFTAAATSPETAGDGAISLAVGDFNRDGKLDLAVANFLANTVTILLGDGTGDFTAAALSPTTDGFEPQSVVAGDFNLDGKLDLAVESSLNVTILLGDGTGAFIKPATAPESAGTVLRQMAVGDFNRDGRPDLAVPSFTSDNVAILLNTCAQPAPVKPAVWRFGTWLLRNTLTSGPADLTFGYGLATDRPLMCDWDGNGSKTPGILRNGVWYLSNTNSSAPAQIVFSYGLPGDVPICGDWDGDGDETIGVVRGATWYLRNANSTGLADLVFVYGIVGDIPLVGDWNGDGVDTVGVKRAAQWLLRNTNTAGVADLTFAYGLAADTGVVGDWNNDGVDTVGVVRGNQWLLRNSNTAGVADLSFLYGMSGDMPLVWR